MTRHRDAAPFQTRRAAARRMIARGTSPAPVHLADQYGAARDEARGLHDRVGALLPILQPDREWFHRAHADPPNEVRAYLLAAVLGCVPCCHLRRGGPQPALVLLPLRRVACTRCAGTFRRLPPGDEDRCDVCGARGVVMFHPFACHIGPTIVAGDACPGCAGVLGIGTGEKSA